MHISSVPAAQGREQIAFPPTARFRNLTELRLVFALIVVLAHLVGLAGIDNAKPLIEIFSSEYAVQGFFIISGFLVYKSYANLRNLKVFYVRRLLRIYPAYFCSVVFFLFLSVLVHRHYDWWENFHEIRSYLFWNLILLNFMKSSLPEIFSMNSVNAINGALWTIKLEVMFYVIVPLLFWLGRKISHYLLCMFLVAIGVFWGSLLDTISNTLSVSLPDQLYYQLPGQLQFFAIGIMLFGVTQYTARGVSFYLVSAAICLLWVLSGNYESFVVALLLTGLILSVIRLPELSPFMSKNDFSYGVYLCHFPIIQISIVIGLSKLPVLLYTVIIFLIVFAYAALSWFLVERKFLSIGWKYR